MLHDKNLIFDLDSAVEKWFRSSIGRWLFCSYVCTTQPLLDNTYASSPVSVTISGLQSLTARSVEIFTFVVRRAFVHCPAVLLLRVVGSYFVSVKNVWSKAQIPLGSSRHVSTWLDTFDVSSASRRACRAVLLDKLDTAEMHGLDTSNVLSRVETWRDEPSGIRAYPSSTLWIASLYTRCSNAVELSIKPRHYVGGMLQCEFKYDNLKILMRIFDLIGLYNSQHNSLHAQPMCTTLHCSNIVYLQHGGGE